MVTGYESIDTSNGIAGIARVDQFVPDGYLIWCVHISSQVGKLDIKNREEEQKGGGFRGWEGWTWDEAGAANEQGKSAEQPYYGFVWSAPWFCPQYDSGWLSPSSTFAKTASKNK